MTELSEPVKRCIEDFKRLAVQIGPKFKYLEAQAAGIWGSHRSMILGYNFNAIKEFAGLPVNKKRGSSDAPIRSPRSYTSKPRHHRPRRKEEKVKLCLGYADTDMEVDCKAKVPRGEFFCPRCKIRKDSMVYDG